MGDPAAPAPAIRPASEDDSSELARLVTALGHPTTPEQLAERWRTFTAAGERALVAVLPDGRLAGLATLHRMVVLHRPRPVGRITALVVDPAVRGRGIGRALVAAAEEEFRSSGCGLLEVTSNLRRTDAHAFYDHLGLERTSLRFARGLVPAD